MIIRERLTVLLRFWSLIKRTMTMWEYKVVVPDLPRTFEEVLNEYGRQGWELVCVDGTPESYTTFYFKRQK